MIKLQIEDFNLEDEINFIKVKHRDIGAVSNFVGYVRNINNQKKVSFIHLEVYKEMALKTLENISAIALKKWDLIDILIIHRFGKLNIHEKIVLVSTFSSHRKDSLSACEFIMDYLKQEATIWKKEHYSDGYKWLQNTKLKN